VAALTINGRVECEIEVVAMLPAENHDRDLRPPRILLKRMFLSVVSSMSNPAASARVQQIAVPEPVPNLAAPLCGPVWPSRKGRIGTGVADRK